MKICPSCKCKCAESIKYCPRCNRYLGGTANISEREYYKNTQSQNKKVEIQCPYCQSTDTSKITLTSKAINTAIFGIFGTKRHKQWHCNNCNSDF